MRLCIVLLLALSACLCSIELAVAQEIVASPIGKAPPGGIPKGGIQVDLYNRTATKQRLQVRMPGGNWFVFGIPARTGVNLRCEGSADHFEASLAEQADEPLLLMPGVIYELMSQSSTGHVVLVHH